MDFSAAPPDWRVHSGRRRNARPTCCFCSATISGTTPSAPWAEPGPVGPRRGHLYPLLCREPHLHAEPGGVADRMPRLPQPGPLVLRQSGPRAAHLAAGHARARLCDLFHRQVAQRRDPGRLGIRARSAGVSAGHGGPPDELRGGGAKGDRLQLRAVCRRRHRLPPRRPAPAVLLLCFLHRSARPTPPRGPTGLCISRIEPGRGLRRLSAASWPTTMG